MYDYIVYGSGPSGILTSILLKEKGYSVCIVEKNNTLGGCWRVIWEDGLFKEHSPRVLSIDKYTIKLLSKLNIHLDKDTEYVYKNFTKMSISTFYNYLSYTDFLKVGYSFVFSNRNITVKNWLDQVNLSNNGRKFFEYVSLLLADIPDKVILKHLFGKIDVLQKKELVKFIEPEKMIKHAYEYLKENGIPTYLNSTLKWFDNYGNNNLNIKGKNHVLAIPPNSLKNVLLQSSAVIKFNWGSNILNLLENSYYNGISFQIHLTNDVILPKDWLWSMKYDAVILKHKYSKNENVKCVLSGVFIDQTKIKSSLIVYMKNKINEIIRDLNIQNKIYAITSLNEKLELNNNNKYIKYDFPDSAFVENIDYGTVGIKGKLNNFFTVGCHTISDIASINTALQSAENFITEYV